MHHPCVPRTLTLHAPPVQVGCGCPPTIVLQVAGSALEGVLSQPGYGTASDIAILALVVIVTSLLPTIPVLWVQRGTLTSSDVTRTPFWCGFARRRIGMAAAGALFATLAALAADRTGMVWPESWQSVGSVRLAR